MSLITGCFGQFFSRRSSNQDRHEKITRTPPACGRPTFSTERWICSWHYWLSTSSSTMITVSLVDALLVCCWCAAVGAIFENLYFTR